MAFFLPNIYKKKKNNFVHDLSKITHMHMKRALTLSREFCANCLLAMVCNTCVR